LHAGAAETAIGRKYQQGTQIVRTPRVGTEFRRFCRKGDALVPVDERMVDRQAFHQRGSLGQDVLVVAGLRPEQRGLQHSGIAHSQSAAIALHQHRVHAEHIGHGQVAARHAYLASSR
jgi:hypothetical protein